MITVSVLIGNSDNKLSQERWASFISSVGVLVTARYQRVFFQGFSAPAAPWQNACWVFEADETTIPSLRDGLASLACAFEQDSIALVVGKTELVSGG